MTNPIPSPTTPPPQIQNLGYLKLRNLKKEKSTFQLHPSWALIALPLSHQSCKLCFGTGFVDLLSSKKRPCNCVYRSVTTLLIQETFKIKLKQLNCIQPNFKKIIDVSRPAYGGNHSSAASLYSVKGRPKEEFLADFWLLARRILADLDFRIFRLHLMDDNNYIQCCKIIKMDRGNFFHRVYRIKELIGKEAVELKPFALFPIDEYFTRITRG